LEEKGKRVNPFGPGKTLLEKIGNWGPRGKKGVAQGPAFAGYPEKESQGKPAPPNPGPFGRKGIKEFGIKKPFLKREETR